ncbi:glutamate racemase [Uliginosibacterium sediminicola]|uniref:Glutamate racemase n=1 Tax=Uliginosibacterium sediminicola TaxID=2024550 RepID=A0ABU9Z3N6_9RHOO
MTDTRPIGVFDSGVGGLSVLREIRARLPHEELLYVADSGYAPYGNRSAAEIIARSQYISEFLLAQGAKALVIACNTATAAAAADLRARWPALPIIGMEPAVKPATLATRSGVVGVLATSGTLASARFAALLDTFGQGVEVVTQACVGLVEHIERGELAAPATRALLARYLQPLLDAGADVIVLGCTHYVFLRDEVQALAGPSVRLIDTGAAVAAELARKLAQHGALHTDARAAGVRFWLSGEPALSASTLRQLWPAATSAEIAVLPD